MQNQSLHYPLVNDKIRFIGVSFNVTSDRDLYDVSGKIYTYKTVFEHELNELVVVEARDKFGVAQVVDLDQAFPINETKNFRWVVSRVDQALYLEQLAKEKQVVRELEKLKAAHMRAQALEALGLSEQTLALFSNNTVQELNTKEEG